MPGNFATPTHFYSDSDSDDEMAGEASSTSTATESSSYPEFNFENIFNPIREALDGNIKYLIIILEMNTKLLLKMFSCASDEFRERFKWSCWQ